MPETELATIGHRASIARLHESLANARTISEKATVGDMAVSLRDALERAGADKVVVDGAADLFIQAKMDIGRILGPPPGKGPGRGKKTSDASDVLTRDDRTECRRVAWTIEDGVYDAFRGWITNHSGEHLSFRHALILARLTPDLQRRVIQLLQTGAADSLQEAVRVARKEQIIASGDMILEGHYRTIVIDPPWPIQKISRDVAPNQEGLDYATMTVEEIAELEMPAHEECHLYVWTTQRFLRDTFDIVVAWGLKPLVTMVWRKAGGFQPVGLPQYNCEFVLLARRGGMPFLDTKNFMCCFDGVRRGHSRKPSEFYDLVRRVSPEPRADIFNREAIDGFVGLGWEAGKFDAV